jgi:hypothetical protein
MLKNGRRWLKYVYEVAMRTGFRRSARAAVVAVSVICAGYEAYTQAYLDSSHSRPMSLKGLGMCRVFGPDMSGNH